jgi:hypothetical protein
MCPAEVQIPDRQFARLNDIRYEALRLPGSGEPSACITRLRRDGHACDVIARVIPNDDGQAGSVVVSGCDDRDLVGVSVGKVGRIGAVEVGRLRRRLRRRLQRYDRRRR